MIRLRGHGHDGAHAGYVEGKIGTGEGAQAYGLIPRMRATLKVGPDRLRDLSGGVSSPFGGAG